MTSCLPRNGRKCTPNKHRATLVDTVTGWHSIPTIPRLLRRKNAITPDSRQCRSWTSEFVFQALNMDNNISLNHFSVDALDYACSK